MLIDDRKTHGYSRYKPGIGDVQPVNTEALIVDGQLLGFNLLGINAIREIWRVKWFNDISTLDGYLMPNPVCTISYIIFK